METVVYRNISNLTDIIQKNIIKIRQLNPDLIIGIPRSGIIPASYIALLLNRPFTDIDSFLNNKIYGSGNRFKNLEIKNKTALVIDDSISSGKALIEVKNKLKIKNDWLFKFCAVYARKKSQHLVDIFFENIEGDRIFEWNIFHHADILKRSCLDIDGVLCRDPTPEENDDGEKYHKFLLTAEPKFIPTVKIKTLISCRLEKYRNETVFWLNKHNIKYDNLIMLNLPDKNARQAWGKYGEYKAEEYIKNPYVFFIESSLNEAKKIKACSNKTVYCTEIMNII